MTIDVLESISPDRKKWETLREISLLEIDEKALYRSFFTLSSGEQTKILLAALFLKETTFYS